MYFYSGLFATACNQYCEEQEQRRCARGSLQGFKRVESDKANCTHAPMHPCTHAPMRFTSCSPQTTHTPAIIVTVALFLVLLTTVGQWTSRTFRFEPFTALQTVKKMLKVGLCRCGNYRTTWPLLTTGCCPGVNVCGHCSLRSRVDGPHTDLSQW
jgi:hypothetical protein